MESDRNCIEIYNPDLTMYHALAYTYDEGMTWFARCTADWTNGDDRRYTGILF